MDIFNLNSWFFLLHVVSILFLTGCHDRKCLFQMTVVNLPSVNFINFNEKEVLNAKIYFKRNNTITDTGCLRMIHKSDEKDFLVRVNFKKIDSVFIQDEIIFDIAHRKFIMSEIEQQTVKSIGSPCMTSYKINGKFSASDYGILNKNSVEFK
jgi:hypothetical protein